MNDTLDAEKIRLIKDWHDARQIRIGAGASAIHHLSAALRAAGPLDNQISADIEYARTNAIGHMRMILDERCPYV